MCAELTNHPPLIDLVLGMYLGTYFIGQSINLGVGTIRSKEYVLEKRYVRPFDFRHLGN